MEITFLKNESVLDSVKILKEGREYTPGLELHPVQDKGTSTF